MAEITAAAVKSLREQTGLPMMDCKKALTRAGGDIATRPSSCCARRAAKMMEKRAGRDHHLRPASPSMAASSRRSAR